MSANIGFLVVVGVLVSAGVYLLLERSITRMLLGLLLFGNGVNLLILTSGGTDGNPPIVGRESESRVDGRPAGSGDDPDGDRHHDGHRRLRARARLPVVQDHHAGRRRERPRGHARSCGAGRPPRPPTATAPTTRSPASRAPAATHSTRTETPFPLEELKNLEDLECYEDLHDGDFDDDGTPTRPGSGRSRDVSPHIITALAPLPGLVPMLAAAATLVLGRRPRAQRISRSSR